MLYNVGNMPRYNEPSQKQLQFVQWYTSPASPTYDNVVQSALKAGYNESYAKSHAYRKLVPLAKKKLRKIADDTQKGADRSSFYTDLLRKAEDNIRKDLEISDTADDRKLALRQKSAHFTAERIGKEKWASKQIVENSGLFTLTSDTLATLSNALSGATQQQQPAIKADYTVKLEDQDTKSDTKE